MKHIAGKLRSWMMRMNKIVIEMIAAILLINICIAVIGSIISGEVLKFGLGVLFGTAYAIFAVIHMAETIETILELPKDDAAKYAAKGYFVRYIAAIAVMFPGFKLELFYFLGVFPAMMSVKFSVWMRLLTAKLIKEFGKGR